MKGLETMKRWIAVFLSFLFAFTACLSFAEEKVPAEDLAQFDDFVRFYGIQPGAGMYIAPEERVAVW